VCFPFYFQTNKAFNLFSNLYHTIHENSNSHAVITIYFIIIISAFRYFFSFSSLGMLYMIRLSKKIRSVAILLLSSSRSLWMYNQSWRQALIIVSDSTFWIKIPSIDGTLAPSNSNQAGTSTKLKLFSSPI